MGNIHHPFLTSTTRRNLLSLPHRSHPLTLPFRSQTDLSLRNMRILHAGHDSFNAVASTGSEDSFDFFERASFGFRVEEENNDEEAGFDAAKYQPSLQQDKVLAMTCAGRTRLEILT